MPNTDSVKLKTVGWDNIDWRKVDRYVYKLQTRIYAASRCGDIKQVRKLQKTLLRSWSNKALAVRRVTTENRGKKTAGVDGIKNLSPEVRVKLIGQLKLTGKSKPTRRVWIPKPGKDEKRPLGIPTMYDRALQGVVKAALEPEWEAQFESSSYGFRPGRSCHDAIRHIKDAIQKRAKYVLDADIAKCFDCINHNALLDKLNYRGKVRQQIKAWLKSGVIDKRVFTAVTDGTPQGGVVSPLLANVALHGIQRMLEEYAETLNMREDKYPHRTLSKNRKIQTLAFVRYADDFVVIHKSLEVIQKCRELISYWLKDIGLELKPSKTRIAHTLIPEYSEDGKVGFDFLGYYIRQYPSGRHKSAKNGANQIIGFNTLITPSKQSLIKHQENIKKTIKKHKHASQIDLINDLNPIIRGWCNYYSFSDAKTTGEFSRQDHLVYQKLRAWGRFRCKNLNTAHNKYFHQFGGRNWAFTTKKGNANSLRLLFHGKFESSSTSYIKVKGDKSPYDGDLVYWSTRMGRNPELPNTKALLLKKQKGKCSWCGLYFHNGDLLEKDHILATALGGKNEFSNYQLLHGGKCHNEKTN
ncbi:group II intron reverse transcriptase/maturase [Pleurocapsa sp. FMAR1]|uniref:group II intron reverse transcriptase/maturase n=1 Tax=Pleurocapsa sp. FMAR1 TaxID=3040204 RepID=UPI0029C8C365|nr:group II intron reverse transcriptase/maturase [Pleurocapsa sp. FMAR1]